jgi:hypothetical protein
MPTANLAHLSSALSEDDATVETTYVGDEIVRLPSTRTVSYSREISWGSQSLSVLLLGTGGDGNASNSASKTPSSGEIHIFMDASDRELCGTNRPRVEDLLTSGANVVRRFRERTHPSNGALENLSTSHDAPPPSTFTSLPSIQILRTGSGNSRIIKELLLEESFNGSAGHNSATRSDDPLACWRLGYHPRWSASAGGDSNALSDVPPLSFGSRSLTGTCPVASRPDNNGSNGSGIKGMRGPDSSALQRKPRDAPPRMPSR